MNTTITIDLSVQGIDRAIRKLEHYRDRVEERTCQLVAELTNGGAEMARYAFGSTATVESTTENYHGIIDATGEAVNIMEFGAGLATMEGHPLAPNAAVPVRKWSYSELVGSGEGYANAVAGNVAPGATEPGYWHFGGAVYTEVIPRHGMLDARDYIVSNAEAKARTVFSK